MISAGLLNAVKVLLVLLVVSDFVLLAVVLRRLRGRHHEVWLRLGSPRWHYMQLGRTMAAFSRFYFSDELDALRDETLLRWRPALRVLDSSATGVLLVVVALWIIGLWR
jgi:hypothetical protein